MFSLQSYTPDQIIINISRFRDEEVVRACYLRDIGNIEEANKHFLKAMSYQLICYSVAVN